jgi:NADP-dependent 3-hydroxy acid dehydrogenase YdfG
MNKLGGAVVVLTGASSGIGRVAAQLFARKRAKLVLASRGAEALDRVTKLCIELGAEAIGIPTDVREESQVFMLRDAALARFGRIDVWVNDAAVYMLGNLEDTPSDVVRELFDINVMGTLYGSKAALSQFRKQGKGTLISLGSVAARAPYAKASAYCASKHAIQALTASLRQELVGTRIRACLVTPATVDTPFFDHAANYTGFEMKALPPIQRPYRVARAIVRCAEVPRSELVVGGTPRMMALFQAAMPWLYERVLPQVVARAHLGPMPAPKAPGSIPRSMPPYSDEGGWWRGRESVLEPPPAEAPALGAMPAE